MNSFLLTFSQLQIMRNLSEKSIGKSEQVIMEVEAKFRETRKVFNKSQEALRKNRNSPSPVLVYRLSRFRN